MAGYAVTARIEATGPRVARRPDTHARPVALGDGDDESTIDLVGRPLDEVLAERWASIREGWAITTFFLFDPESWR